jgi:hypothetical protein
MCIRRRNSSPCTRGLSDSIPPRCVHLLSRRCKLQRHRQKLIRKVRGAARAPHSPAAHWAAVSHSVSVTPAMTPPRPCRWPPDGPALVVGDRLIWRIRGHAMFPASLKSRREIASRSERNAYPDARAPDPRGRGCGDIPGFNPSPSPGRDGSIIEGSFFDTNGGIGSIMFLASSVHLKQKWRSTRGGKHAAKSRATLCCGVELNGNLPRSRSTLVSPTFFFFTGPGSIDGIYCSVTRT